MRNRAGNANRFDRTLRVVMWSDAFLSVWMVIACFFAVPVVATVGVPDALMAGVVVTSIVSAVLLAAFGAITAVLLMVRMNAGQVLLPPRLHLPLPPGMRPPGTRCEG